MIEKGYAMKHDTSELNNLILLTDSYKLTHWKMYPAGTQRVYSYFESRGGQFPETVFFGLQYLLKKHLVGAVITQEKIDDAEIITEKHLGDRKLFNREGWERILEKHRGKLPISIKAVREGTVVPLRNVLMTVENTDPESYWLTSALETLLVHIWYPCTVATLSMNIKKRITGYLEKTGTPKLIDFKLHDFGFRGASSAESAAIGDAAHLLSFKGTDTISGLLLAREYYDADMPGNSIPASEHTVMTALGEAGEAETVGHILDAFPEGYISIVADSYDVFRACRQIFGEDFRERILLRKGTVVIRPDSGNPEEVVVKVLEILKSKFGATRNSKGYFVLPDRVRIIQGDNVNYDSIGRILSAMEKESWSADNITFGMGGALLQMINRDTQQFAFKASNITIKGVEHEVSKSPITDMRKASKAGKLKLVLSGKTLKTVKQAEEGDDQMVEVFRNGTLLREYDFDSIRKRLNTYTAK